MNEREYSVQELCATRDCSWSGCSEETSRGVFCHIHARRILHRDWADRGIFMRGDPRPFRWRGMLGTVEDIRPAEDVNDSWRTIVTRAKVLIAAEEMHEMALWEQEGGNGHVAGRNAEVKELVKEIRANGFKVVSGGKHMRVLDAKGRVVIDEHGPVILSSTPGDANWRDMAEARLRKAGILKDKKGPVRRKGERGDEGQEEEEKLTREERDRLKRATAKLERADESRDRHQRTMEIRARLEPLIAKAGGWNLTRHVATTGVMVSELGAVLELWSQRRNQPDMFASSDAARKSAETLRAGGTLSDARCALWEDLVNDWDAAENPRLWYMERMREARGLKPDWRVAMNLTPSTLPGAVVEEPPPNEAAAVEPVERVVRGDEPFPAPFVRALRAVYLMARGSTGDDWEEILAYARVVYDREEDEGA